MKKIIFLLLSLLLLTESRATHLMGADITYKSLGASKYLVTARIFRDCNGIQVSQSNFIVTSSSNNTIVLSNQTKILTRDITGIGGNCPDKSRCAGGAFPYGVEEHVWTAELDLSTYAACDWNIIWEQQARSSYITTGQANQNFYTTAFLNKCVTGDNSSPVFTQLPARYLCHNVNFEYNAGAVDSAEGDSLSYQLVPALQALNTNCTYSGQFSPSRPVRFLGYPNTAQAYPRGLQFSATTGDLLFRPIEQGQVAVIVIEVSEWRKNSSGVWQLIGKVRRDMQVTVITCTTTNRSVPSFKHIPLQWEICANDSVCIDIETTDDDVADSTFISYAETIPGASYTTFYDQAKRAHLRFCWKPQTTDIRNKPYLFYLKVQDNGCPKFGEALRCVQIYVHNPASAYISAGNDTLIPLTADSLIMNGGWLGASGEVAIWRTLGDGSFKDSTNPAASYFPGIQDRKNCSVRLIYALNTLSTCRATSDTVEISFTQNYTNDPQDIINADKDTVRISANSSTNQANGEYWHTLGDGYFADSMALNPLYHFGPSDLLSCEVKMVLISQKACSHYYDTITVFRKELPPSAGADISLANTDTVKLSGISSPFNHRKTYWYSLGDGRFSDSSSMSAKYYLGPNDRMNCSVKIVLAHGIQSSCFVNYDTVEIFPSETPLNAGPDQFSVSADSVIVSGTVWPFNNRQTYWHSMGDGYFKDSSKLNTVYYLGKNDLLNCNVSLVLKHGITNTCIINADTLVLFRQEQGPDAGTDQYLVSGDSVKMNATRYLLNNRHVHWITNGDGYFSDSSDLNTYYHPGQNDKSLCAVLLVLTNGIQSNCFQNSDSVIIRRDHAPVSAGADLNWFAGDSVRLNGMSDTANKQLAFWTTSGDGRFSNPDDLRPWYFPGTADRTNCEVVLMFQSVSFNNCSASLDSVTLHQKEKSVYAGGIKTRTVENQIGLNGISDVVNGQLGYWKTLGDGRFDNVLKAKAIYYMGNNDTSGCETKLVFTSFGNRNCDVQRDTLIIKQLPATPKVSVSFDIAVIDTVFISATPSGSYLTWSTNGSGVFDHPGYQFYLTSAADRQADGLIIKATWNQCGVAADSAIVDVKRLLSVKNAVRIESNFVVYPNPAENQLRIISRNGEKLVMAEVYDMKGARLTVTHFENPGEYVVEVSSLAAGNYFIRLTGPEGEQYSVLVQKR